mgnify:FL=1
MWVGLARGLLLRRERVRLQNENTGEIAQHKTSIDRLLTAGTIITSTGIREDA